MGYEFFIIFISLLATCMLLKSNVLQKQDKWLKVTLISILFIATIVRVYKLGSAMGLNSDEAMGGYNAWSLAHYGVSSHLNSWPVYLIAWGSGMNILYPLLTVPLIKLFGLNVVSYRFPLVLLSIISYYVLAYVLLKTQNKPRLSLFFITILTLSPWTILSNRWAVESNLFPVLMTFALCCYLMCDFDDFKGWRSNFLFVLFNIIIAISAYAYSCDWVFLPFFMIVLYGWLLYKKKINFKHVLVAIAICLLLLWPLILYIYVNYLGGHQMDIFGMTITKMTENRSGDAWVIVKENPLKQIFINIFRFVFYIILKNDYYTGVHGFKACYPFMMIIAVIGLIYTITKKDRKHSPLESYLLITLISAIPLILITWNNFVRDNVLILPVFYFATVGVLWIFRTKRLRQLFVSVFTICLVIFSFRYFVFENKAMAENPIQGVAGGQTSVELPKALDKAEKNNKKTIYVSQEYINTLYTAIRFYDPISPYKFVKDTNNFKDIDNNNTNKNSKDYQFGKYYLTTHITEKMLNDKNAVYIVGNDVSQRDYQGMQHYTYGPYTVYMHKDKK